jgi:hypothetical protein
MANGDRDTLPAVESLRDKPPFFNPQTPCRGSEIGSSPGARRGRILGSKTCDSRLSIEADRRP